MTTYKNVKRKRGRQNRNLKTKKYFSRKRARRLTKARRKNKKRKQTRKAYRPSSHSLKEFFAAFN